MIVFSPVPNSTCSALTTSTSSSRHFSHGGRQWSDREEEGSNGPREGEQCRIKIIDYYTRN